LKELPETAGVVAIRMRNPYPPDVGWVEHLCQGGDEIFISGAETGVDDHGLFGMKHKRVNG
jgi:hypothetical protein